MKFSDFSSDLKIHASSKAPSKPKVTVILPTYSRGHGPLQESIDSVLAQSYRNFELIIVDDGSRDGSAAVLQEYLKKDPRIIVHSYHKNSGLPALRVNQAALRAKGKYIAYQFDDDMWTEHSLQVRVEQLEKCTRPAVAYANASVDIALADGSITTRKLGGPFNYGLLMNGNYIANNTVMHHKSLFDIAGMYDSHVMMRRYSDYDLWLRFAKHADFIWVDEVTSHVRANLVDSLGKEIPLFFARYRKSLSIPRDHLLTPAKINDYDVIDLSQFADTFTDAEIIEYRRMEAAPFLTKFNDYCSDSEMAVAAAARGRKLHLLTVKPDYSTSVDVTIHNFTQLAEQRAITSTFVKENDLPVIDLAGVDVTVLYRTVGVAGSQFVKNQKGKMPLAYLMDDNMLHFHEVGPQHSFLAPGTPTYQNIAQQIQSVDTCIGYSDAINEDLRELNSKTVRLNTNIHARFVQKRTYSRGKRLKVAIMSGAVREDILRELWQALANFASAHANSVEFHFWGLDPEKFGTLECPVFFKPFTHVYESYIRDLSETSFDIALVPLDFSTRAARSKSPVKLLESVAAGAIGIFTDAVPYSDIPDACCVKVENTVEAWEQALNHCYEMGQQKRDQMLENARELVLSRYTTESQFYDFLASCEAVRLHSRLGDKAIAYAFHETALGGATLHLIRHASLVASLGFRVVGIVPQDATYGPIFKARWDAATNGACLLEEQWPSGYIDSPQPQRPFQPQDEAAARHLSNCLEPERVGFLHFATWSPTMSLLAKQLGIPCSASVHQFYEGAGNSIVHFADSIHCSSLTHGFKWSSLSKSPARRIVCPVADDYFASFATNRARAAKSGNALRILVSGTLQPRKNQLGAIQAAILLNDAGFDVSLDLIGYTVFHNQYLAECTSLIEASQYKDKFIIHGFIDDPKPFYDKCDLLLISATDESMPQTMLQAMAMGIPVVSTIVGGVGEIIKHRYSGFLAQDDSPEAMAAAVSQYIRLSQLQRLEIIDRAQRSMKFLARPTYVRSELVDLYNQAFEEFARHRKAAQKPGDNSSRTSASSYEQMLLATLNTTRSQISQLSRALDK
ncbi:glycosyltransferase [Pseudomonas glycinae]|uniref:glycosyltransferase n=1 Tax=Pseudomonas glycinae TaxID=1785145 RepID=UPI001C8A8834|nr:glycosyltransferase [Pseudomonas glycinae]MBX8625622.1 glycosyltransferase [Pseudomonas glycinae]